MDMAMLIGSKPRRTETEEPIFNCMEGTRAADARGLVAQIEAASIPP